MFCTIVRPQDSAIDACFWISTRLSSTKMCQSVNCASQSAVDCAWSTLCGSKSALEGGKEHLGTLSSHPSMGKFRAPSTSVGSSVFASTSKVQAQAPPLMPKAKQTQAYSKHSKVLPSGQQRTRLKNVHKSEAAAKDAFARKKKVMQNYEPSPLYVGNLSAEVDETVLKAHFSHCGRILSVDIRCCGGVAVTTVKPTPVDYYKDQIVRQYAIVIFENRLGRHKALKLRGSQLGGRMITVSLSIADLPEVREKIMKRMEEYHNKRIAPDLYRAKKSALKSIKLEPTVLLDPDHQHSSGSGRFRFWGYSLVKNIM
ncbi:hypothetical protein HYDPIDRAFT_35436 [Hydnomerulius pinastri MD-312]|nr:hypothetical protein HYDPIDRAFT_35436 [Hydnomerulius pinastri MD-312]